MGIDPGYGNEFSMRVLRMFRGLLLVLLASGCKSGDEARTLPASRSIIADVVVSVDNRTSNPVLIYAGAGDVSEPLGTVPRMALRSFSVPSSLNQPVQVLHLDARGQNGTPRAHSQSFRLSSGHRVIWTLDRTHNGTVTMR